MTVDRSAARRRLVEGAVIVGSILLAFAIDAWWDSRKQGDDVRQSLEIVRRDLVDADAQLREFRMLSIASSEVSLAAAAALAEPVPPAARSQVEGWLRQAMARRTMRLPRAGYTDMLSSGTLGLIRDRALRDEIVSFYEAAARSEEIVEKNSSLYTDNGVLQAVVLSGLVVPMPRDEEFTDLQTRRKVILEERMGPDFPVRETRMWRLPLDAPEFDVIVASLVQNARGQVVAELLSDQLQERALAVVGQIDAFLANDVRP